MAEAGKEKHGEEISYRWAKYKGFIRFRGGSVMGR